ncbi:MAG TPA: GGDEF domain-containing protein [Candidatus Latescibacteria bacterium]|nr:GGDEF domain-containing protein [Candidatus Handelsmanbacteria bacterium]HIL08823.1 GGDEF domain-containing protein [Candidatus Latescibacterota bacterium]
MAENLQDEEIEPVDIGIIGGGKGGTALLQALKDIPQVNIVGICDINPKAPAVLIAREMGIDTYTDSGQLILEQSMDWLLNVTHKSITQRHILSRELSDITVIDGHIAELIWHLLLDLQDSLKDTEDADDSLYALVWTVIQRIVNIAQPVHRELEHIAFHDPLTGLYSRHMLRQFIERETSHVCRNGQPLSLAILDIDHFKDVNDKFGHDVGDQTLKDLADLFRNSCRATDLAARYGGEEFIAVLPSTSQDASLIWAERMRERVEESLRRPDDEKVTISIGVATLLVDTEANPNLSIQVTSDLLFKRADNALYEAKNNGRNRVVTSEISIPEK